MLFFLQEKIISRISLLKQDLNEFPNLKSVYNKERKWGFNRHKNGT